jgi:Dolichyl-phosphate-mannose-protein mannosyltransferase
LNLKSFHIFILLFITLPMLQSFTTLIERASIKYFLLAWLVINVIQAACTQLSPDEAYYYCYSTHLAWGYFDHPPMIALFVWCGKWLGGALGVRLFAVLAQVFSLWVLWRVVNDNTKKTIFILANSSFLLFQFFGFIATPDSPLLLFTCLFLFAYQQFCNTANMRNALWLGLCMACMLYSKYHAGLFIIFILISNFKLLTNKYAWLAVSMAALLFIPHLLWQWHNDFPSFKYHLDDRAENFKWQNVPEYVGNILLVYNVLLIPIFFKLLRFPFQNSVFEKTLRYVIIGFLGFFLLATFRGHVQPQWTIIIAPCLIILLCKNIKPLQLKWLHIAALANIVVILLIRIILISRVLPMPNNFSNGPQSAAIIKARANGLPILFCNSYQVAANYNFYQKPTLMHCTRNYFGRANQWQIWPFEKEFNNQKVMLVSTEPFANADSLVTDTANHIKLYTHAINYLATEKLTIAVVAGSSSIKHLQINNPYNTNYEIGDSTRLLLCLMEINAQGHNTNLKSVALPKILCKANNITNVDCKIENTDLQKETVAVKYYLKLDDMLERPSGPLFTIK